MPLDIVDRDASPRFAARYGGFATAWCATALSEHFAAGVMFVGISNQLSKTGTSDIPMELELVHWLTNPYENLGLFMERSPITYIENARTPLLILHGLFGSGTNWRSIARALGTSRTVYLPDLRNHGDSPHTSMARSGPPYKGWKG